MSEKRKYVPANLEAIRQERMGDSDVEDALKSGGDVRLANECLRARKRELQLLEEVDELRYRLGALEIALAQATGKS